MLVVKIEVWPGGNPMRAVEVAHMTAANISNLADTSDYSITADEYGAAHLNIPKSQADFKIEGYERKQSVFNLLKKMCEGALEHKQDK